MVFEVLPYVSVGNISFEMKREEVREKFNNEYEEFKKTPFSENTTDDFGCCHVYYNKQDKCEAIEFFESAKVFFEGELITNKPYNEVKKIFESKDSDIEFNDSGFTSLKYGIGIFALYVEEDSNELVEGVIVFKKGYYN